MPEEISNLLYLIAIVIIIASFVLALGLFPLFLLKRKPLKDISLTSIDDNQDLYDDEAIYFSYVRYDSEKRAIILKQSQVFRKCVVTLIVRQNGKLKMARYNLEYAPNDLFCAIKIDGTIEGFKVVLESVDGSISKHAPIDNYKQAHIVYSVIVTLVFAIGAIVYVMMCGTLLIDDQWVGFNLYYTFAALSLLFILIIVGGYVLGEILSKKGKF